MSYEFLGDPRFRQHIAECSSKTWLRQHAVRVPKNQVNVVAEIPGSYFNYDQNVMVKLFGWRNTMSILFSPVMRSRAKKSWDMAGWLLDHGVATPEPLAVYTARKYGIIQENFYISKAIQQYRTARHILHDKTVNRGYKDQLIQSLAEIVRRIHHHHVVHNDLTLANFLVKDVVPEDISLVDLNRATKWWRLPRIKRLADIARMDLCSCDFTPINNHHCYRDVFLRTYSDEHYARDRRLLQKLVRNRSRQKRMKHLRSIWKRN